MKNLAICGALIIVVFCMLFWVRQQSGDIRETKATPSGMHDFNLGNGGHATIISTQSVAVSAPSVMNERQDVNESSSSNSPIYSNDLHTTKAVSMNKPVHEAATPSTNEDRAHFISIAFDRAKKMMEIANTNTAIVEYKDSMVVVTFPVLRKGGDDRPPYPGSDYLARVKIDRNTGNVLEILGAQ